MENMKVQITKHFDFEAAHRLPKVAATHKCGRMHGHSYRVVVVLQCDESGLVDGMVADYATIAEAWTPLDADLDHRTLNQVEGLENPTTEVLASWIFRRLQRVLPFLVRVTVEESRTTSCTFPAP